MQQLNLEHVAHHHLNLQEPATERVPEARYAYYHRCQVFRKGGEQCKAPAEKSSLICHAHAGQTAMAVRRERERRAVLEQAVAEMRRRGKPECEMRDLFMDFNGIQVTLAVMAQALIDGRIDCKTAGRLVVNLQIVSKLLWIYHRGQKTKRALTTKGTRSTPLSRAQGRSGQAPKHEGVPQICADDRRLDKPERLPELLTTSAKATEAYMGSNWVANQREERPIGLMTKVHAFVESWRRLPHSPPGWARAA
jgi:hypothetical protein